MNINDIFLDISISRKDNFVVIFKIKIKGRIIYNIEENPITETIEEMEDVILQFYIDNPDINIYGPLPNEIKNKVIHLIQRYMLENA